MSERKTTFAALFSVLTLVALSTGAFLLVQREAQQIDHELISARHDAADASASAVTNFLNQAKAHSQGTARSLEPWPGKQSSESRLSMDRAISYSSLFDAGMYLTTLDGRVVATSSSLTSLLNLSRPAKFLEAASKGPIATAIFQDPLIKLPVLAAVSPVTDTSGRVSTVLVALIDVRRLGPMLDGLRLAGSETLVVDPAGQVVDLKRATGVDQTNRTVALLLKGPASSDRGSARYAGPGGVEAIAVWATSTDGWKVILHEETTEVLRESKGPVRMSAIGLGIMALVGSLLVLMWLRATKRAGQESDRVKRAFLAIAGHELRTPLTSIRGFSQTLEGRWEKLGDDQRKQMLSTIARQARNLENLIERLLLGAQLEGGIKQSPSLRELDVTEAVEKAVRHQQAQAPLHDFDVRLEPGLTAKADTKGLNQVLGQLLENAVKYSPSGGTVTITGKKISGGVEITVEDQGVGLPSDLSGIFDKFGQGESVDTRVHDEGGVGLGLFIARQHLELMNGTIKAERGKPEGARFVVRLRT